MLYLLGQYSEILQSVLKASQCNCLYVLRCKLIRWLPTVCFSYQLAT